MGDKEEAHRVICQFWLPIIYLPFIMVIFIAFGEYFFPLGETIRISPCISWDKPMGWASGVFCTHPFSLTTKGSAHHLLSTCWLFLMVGGCFPDARRSSGWNLLLTLWRCCHTQEAPALHSCHISPLSPLFSQSCEDPFYTEVNQSDVLGMLSKVADWHRATEIIRHQNWIPLYFCLATAVLGIENQWTLIAVKQ